MYTAGAQKSLSAGKMQVLARAIVRIAFDIYQSEESRKAFVMVIAIESGFNRFAQSPTGPKGYGQLAKNTFKEALADCGVKDLHDEDVWEQDLNLYAAACYYKKLVDARGGDTYAAAIAYNQGPNSESDKTYRKSGRLEAIEPMKYLAKFSFLDRQVTPEKPSGVPSIADLPTPKVTERN
jgi:membrane-bound lytic murein transglycosylase MltF